MEDLDIQDIKSPSEPYNTNGSDSLTDKKEETEKYFDDIYTTILEDLSGQSSLLVGFINTIFNDNFPPQSKITCLSDEMNANFKPDFCNAVYEIEGYIFIIVLQLEKDANINILLKNYVLDIASHYINEQNSIRLPSSAVISIRDAEKKPAYSPLTFTCKENGEYQSFEVNMQSIALSDFTPKELYEKRLFPVLAFYPAIFEYGLTLENHSDKLLTEMIEGVLYLTKQFKTDIAIKEFGNKCCYDMLFYLTKTFRKITKTLNITDNEKVRSVLETRTF